MKTAWKRCPVQTYDMAGMERWLEQMAADGYLFRKTFGSFTQFEVSDPKPRRRYRLDANPKLYDKPDREMIELYKQAGWTFVCSYWGKFFLYYSDDPLAVEPYTDPQSQSLTLDRLVKECRSNVFSNLLFLLSVALPILGIYIWLGDAYDAQLSSTICIPFVWFLDALTAWSDLRAIRQMQTWLANGRPLQSFHPRKRYSLFKSFTYAMHWLIFLAFLAEVIVFPFLTKKMVPLEQAELDFPVVSLADVAGEGYVPDPYEQEVYELDFSYTPPQYKWQTDTNNYAKRKWNTLSPNTWVIHQSGEVNGEHFSMIISRYEMLSEGLAYTTLEDLSEYDTITEVTVEGADYFWLDDSSNTIYAARDKVVLDLWCSESLDLSGFYDEIAAMLTNA